MLFSFIFAGIACSFYGIDATKPMVRREVREVHPHEQGAIESFEVGSRGTQTEVSDKVYPRPPYDPPEETCNDDFLEGVFDSNNCTDKIYHRKILDQGMCQRAAELANAGIEHNFFEISSDYFNVHPQGCFKWTCETTHDRTSTNTSTCYYYNGNGDEPDDPKGYPICYRAEYLNGTTDTNGECDEGFQNVMDEEMCRDAAECLGYATEQEFRVGEWNWSKHDEYPKGCFIRNDTGAFQFNNVSSLANGEPGHPYIGGGTPICNVTHKVHYD